MGHTRTDRAFGKRANGQTVKCHDQTREMHEGVNWKGFHFRVKGGGLAPRRDPQPLQMRPNGPGQPNRQTPGGGIRILHAPPVLGEMEPTKVVPLGMGPIFRQGEGAGDPPRARESIDGSASLNGGIKINDP